MHIGTSECVMHTICVWWCTSHVSKRKCVCHTSGVHIGTSECVLHTICVWWCTSHVSKRKCVCHTSGVHIGTSECVMHTIYICLTLFYSVGSDGKVALNYGDLHNLVSTGGFS